MRQIVAFFACAMAAFAQYTYTAAQRGLDATGHVAWKVVGSGALAARPSTCSAGSVYFCTGAGCTAGNRIHQCVSANTWDVQGTAAGSGITTLNTLNGAEQTFAVGSAGTDFAISSAGTTHTFNIPTVSAANRGLVTPSLFDAWNAKQDAITEGTGTFAEMGASSPAANALWILTDASSPGVCSAGGGTSRSICVYNGSVWTTSSGMIAGGSGGQVPFQTGAGVTGFEADFAYNSTDNILGLRGGYTAGQNSVATGTFKFHGLTSGTVTVQSQDAAGTWTFKWPADDGTPGQVLSTDGNGVADWVDPAGASTAASVTVTPAGNIAATNVQAALQELDTEKHATPTGTPDGSKFLRDDNSWQPIPGGTTTAPYRQAITTGDGTSITIAAATHGFGHDSLIVELRDSSGNAVGMAYRVIPDAAQDGCTSTECDVVITLAEAMNGTVLINGGTGPAGADGEGGAVSDGDKGDIVVSGTGTVYSIDTGVIENADINASAAIAQSKMAALTANRVMLTDASGFASASSVTNTTLGYLDATSSIQTQLNAKQASDGTLTALASYNTNGILVQTAADTFAGRTLTGPAAGISVTNGNGVSGNPTLALANDLAAVEGLSANGMAARTGTDTWAARTITGTSNEIAVTNGDGVSGNPTLALASTVNLSSKVLRIPNSTSLARWAISIWTRTPPAGSGCTCAKQRTRGRFRAMVAAVALAMW
jgi:hypothetical protein